MRIKERIIRALGGYTRADMENGKTLIRENDLFRMEVIREGRRRG